MDLPSPDKRRNLILLPSLDRRGITSSEVEMIEREHPYTEPDRSARGEIEDEKEDVG